MMRGHIKFEHYDDGRVIFSADLGDGSVPIETVVPIPWATIVAMAAPFGMVAGPAAVDPRVIDAPAVELPADPTGVDCFERYSGLDA